MAKRKVVLLESQEDLKIVLRRMTNRELYHIHASVGEADFRGEEKMFRFSNANIANEIGGCPTNVARVIQESDLDYVHFGKLIFVWLDDLEERLEAFHQKHQ